MKKITIDSKYFDKNENMLSISLREISRKIKVVDAKLKIKISSSAQSLPSSFVVNYKPNTTGGWDNVDTISSIKAGDIIEINVSDELQDALDNKYENLSLVFAQLNSSDIINDESELNIDYITLSQFQNNGSSQNLNLGKSGNAAVDLTTGKLSLSVPIATTDNKVLPLSINANYNSTQYEKKFDKYMPENWDLNINQLLIKNDDEEKLSFTYIDENSKEQTIEERYYYLDEDNNKQYIDKSDLCVDLDGKLKYKILVDNPDQSNLQQKESLLKALREITIEGKNFGKRFFDSSQNILQIINNLKGDEENSNFMLRIVTENDIKNFRCINYNYSIHSRTIKEEGFGLHYVTYEYPRYVYNFINDEGESVEFIIDYDPNDCNSIAEKLGNSTIDIDCNYFQFSTSRKIEEKLIANIYLYQYSLEPIKKKEIFKDVFTSLESPSGLKLVSSIKDIPGAELVDYEPEEIINIKEQLKQLNLAQEEIENILDSNNKLICSYILTKDLLNKQLKNQKINLDLNQDSLDTQELIEKFKSEYALKNRNFASRTSAKNYLKVDENDTNSTKRFNEEMISQLEEYYKNGTEIVNNNNQTLVKDDVKVVSDILLNESSLIYSLGFDYSGENGSLKAQKENQALNKEIYTKKIIKDDFLDLIQNEYETFAFRENIPINDIKIDNEELFDIFKSFNDDTFITLSLKDLISINIQIASLIKNNLNYNKKRDEYNKQVEKYQHRLEQLEMQMPVHYLYNDNNIIYGFGKSKDENVFRLILITDAYENTIFFSYQSLDSYRLKNITNSSDKLAIFEYDDDGLLKSITDTRERVVNFEYKDDNLAKIIRSNDVDSYFIYDNDKNLIAILDDNGLGTKLSYENDRVSQISSISAIKQVKNGEIIYRDFKDKSIFDINDFEVFDTMTLTFNNYMSTTLTNEKDKSIVYLFDKYGKVKTIYENKFDKESNENDVKVNDFSYQNNKLSSKVSSLLYSDNYLKDVCFNLETTSQISSLYLGTSICGTGNEPYYYKICEKFHTLTAQESNKKASVLMSEPMLNLINTADNLCKCKTYMLSGWAKANSAFILTDENIDDYPQYIKERKFEICTQIKYIGENSVETFKRSFDWRNTDWQYCAVPVKLDKTKQVEKITAFIDYSNNTGDISFTDLSFFEADWETIEYDQNNLPIKKQSAHSNWVTTFEYDKDSINLLKETISSSTNPDTKFVTTYEYDKYGKQIRSTDYNGIVKENVYDNKGILIKSLTYHKDQPSSKFYEEQMVDEKGNVTSNVNALGEEISKLEYSDSRGLITNQTDENGIKTSYGYRQDDTLLETSTSVEGIENTNTFGYTQDYLTSVKHNNFDIKYDYDNKGRISNINIAGSSKDYITKNYTENEETTILASNEEYRQTFNDEGKLLKTFYTPAYNDGQTKPAEQLISQNFYDTQGNLVVTKDLIENNSHKVFLDKFSNAYKEENTQHGLNITLENSYDESHSNIESTTITLGEDELFYNYSYSTTPDAKLQSILLPNDIEQFINYDNLGRLSNIKTGSISKEFSYLKNGDHASNLISKLDFAVSGIKTDNLRYLYDKKGNITEIRQNNNLIARYKYDGLSRIIREDNKNLQKTTTFAYDEGGNITKRTQYPFTLADNLDYLEGREFDYHYPAFGWKDQLMQYNGENFEYDKLGNPTLYRDKTLKWSHGRQLDKFGDIASYSYNASGIRTKKISNGFTTQFFLNGNKIIAQKDAINTMFFYYGTDGLTGFNLNGNNYLYKKNAQNDIIGIYNDKQELICKYEYDAWGAVKCCYKSKDENYIDIEEDYEYNNIEDINRFVAFKNPFRYRSYYYDFETRLYYLNSRYYDPELGRFINADSLSILENTKDVINGLNLYAYCINNPVNTSDDDGELPKWLKWLIGGLTIAVVAIATIVAIAVTAGAAGIGFGAAFAGAFGLGGATSIGGFAGFMAGVTIGTLTGSTIGLLGGGFTSLLNGKSFWDGAADGFMWGAISGAISGGISTLSFGGVGNFGYKGQGNIFQVGLQGFVGLSTYIGKSLSNNETPTFIGIILSLFGGITGGLLNNASIPIQIFVSGGVEFIGFLTGVLKKMWKLPNKNPIMQIT